MRVAGEVRNLVGHVEVGEELSGLDDSTQLLPLFWQGVHTCQMNKMFTTKK